MIDCTKKGVVGSSGSDGFDYLGSLTYTSNSLGLQLESAAFGDGVIRVTGTSQEINYFLTDHLGSVRVIVDKNGAVKERNDYYAFGAKHIRGDYPQSDNRYDYNGKEEQTTGDLKFLDYGARMYDGALGRWFNVDPLAEKHFNNSPYVFCANNPVKYVDPNGEDYTVYFQWNDDRSLGGITIAATIYITGKYASAERAGELNLLAKETFKSNTINGIQLSFDINYVYDNNKTINQLNLGENLLFFDEYNTGNRSYVRGLKYEKLGLEFIGKHGYIYNYKDIMHETGHLLGLSDRYDEVKYDNINRVESEPHIGYENDLMGSSRNSSLKEVHYQNYINAYKPKGPYYHKEKSIYGNSHVDRFRGELIPYSTSGSGYIVKRP